MKKIQNKTLALWLLSVCLSVAGMAQPLKPSATQALLQGTVTNMKGKPLPKETVILANDKNKKEVVVHTDEAGKFEALVPINATYILKYKTFMLSVDYTKMVIPADKDASYNVLIKIDPPRDFVLEDVHFETGKSALKPSSHKTLNDLVEVLKFKNTMVIEIQGHTDNVGNDESNLKLSQDRAEEVRKYLLSKGIAANRVTAVGYGPTRPVADNATEAGKAKNRRTSLKVIKE